MALQQQLGTLFQELLELWGRFESAGSGASDLAAKAASVKEVVAKIDSGARKVAGRKKAENKDKALKALVEELTPLVADASGSIERRDDEEADSGSRLQDFLVDISRSLIETQRGLNEESLRYVRELDERVPPSHFAIPSLKAELKMGFRDVTGSGVNVVLFSRKEQKERYGESTVSFELAAMPPPPGGVRVALPDLFVVGDEKQRILEAVTRLTVEPDSLGKTLGDWYRRPVYERTRGRALVLRAAPARSRPTRFVVLWPAQTPAENEKGGKLWTEMTVLPLAETADGGVELAGKGEFFRGERRFAHLVWSKQGPDPSVAATFADALNGVASLVHEWITQRTAAGPGSGTSGTT